MRRKRKPILTIIDYSKPSTMRRLSSSTMKRHKLLYHTWVSHGRNWGAGCAPVLQPASIPARVPQGLSYRRDLSGKHGYSCASDGLSPGKNSNARKRAIVVHGADYASPRHLQKYDKLGRSWLPGPCRESSPGHHRHHQGVASSMPTAERPSIWPANGSGRMEEDYLRTTSIGQGVAHHRFRHAAHQQMAGCRNDRGCP